MAHRSEQGNVLGFVLVGALLVASLLGGIYVVRQNAPGQQGTEVANNGISSPETSETNDNSSNTDTKSNDQSKKTDEESLKEALEKQSSQNKNTPPADNTNKNTTNDTTSTQTATLPQTGPADAFVGTAGAALLVGAGISYVRSRRLL